MEHEADSNEMIQDNLENEMYAHISQTGKYINLIVMHPQTWKDLKEEVFSSDTNMTIDRHDLSLKYRGIRVLRSLDMVEGLFEVR
jgi:hypothetical protein